MNQQQNQQQPNDLQKKTEAALSASFAMPPIRTMADDLLEASKGVTVPVVPVAPVVSSGVPTPPVPPIRPLPGQSTANQKPPVPRPSVFQNQNPIQRPPVGNTVAMPVAPTPADKKSFLMSMLLGGGVAVVLAIIIFVGYLFWPKKTNTIADKIPAETLAFVSIKKGANALEQAALPKILTEMGLAGNALGDQWTNLVYGVIPGTSSSEPVAYLLTDNAASVNISGNPNLTLKNLANGSGMIVYTNTAGQADGLSGKNLGDEATYRALAKQLPASPEYLYLGQEGTALLKSFSLLSLDNTGAALFAVAASEQGAKMLPLMVARSNGEKFTKNQLAWETAVKAVPVGAVAVAGHASLASDVDQWRLAQSNNPQLQDLLNALTAQGAAINALKSNVEGNYVVASLATDSPTPDGIAVLPLKDGTVALAKAQMTSLEEALKLLGPLIGGSAYNDVNFADGNYKGVAIRFVNFGDSTHSLDYAFVDSLLLVATSKASMQQLIDAYKGETENFAATFATQGTGQVGWQYLRFDKKVMDKQAAAWKTLLSGFVSTYFEPIKTGVYTGNIAY